MISKRKGPSAQPPATATVISVIALIFALTGPATAALVVTGKAIKNRSVKGVDIGKNTVTGRNIKKRTITGRNIKPHSIKPRHLTKLALGPRGLQGPKGDPGVGGSQGPPGDRGPAGTSVANAPGPASTGKPSPIRLVVELDTSKADCGLSPETTWSPSDLPAPESASKEGTGICKIQFAGDDPSGSSIKWATVTGQDSTVWWPTPSTPLATVAPPSGGVGASATVSVYKPKVFNPNGDDSFVLPVPAEGKVTLVVYYTPSG